jgi:hypothetical protein
MKRKFIINEVALQNRELLRNGRLLRRVGIYGVWVSIVCITIGETINNSPLKIFAMNNEAADMIEELSEIYHEQNK